MNNDPFKVLTTPAPSLSELAATELLQQHYGFDCELKPLVSERDQNFLVTEVDGRQFVLKIANSAEDPAVTDFQNAALQHVAHADSDFPVPRVIATGSGDTTVVATAADGRRHTVRLLSWLEGTPMRFAESANSVAAPLGACLARLGMALREFEHPASRYNLLWDLKRAGGLVELLDHVTDASLRAICANRLAQFRNHVAPQLGRLRSQVIYNDLNPSNVLVSQENPDMLAGVIDFGDMVRSPLVVDAAVAAAYLCSDDADPLADVEEFLHAYTHSVPLAEEEISLLYDLILTRHVMTVVITNWRAAKYPQNRDYILRNEPTARATINGIARMSENGVTERFMKACNLE